MPIKDKLTKKELRDRISIYEKNKDYWKKQLNIAKAEVQNCNEMIRYYKNELKKA